MTVFNLGSINADWVYQVGHFPAPGETISATACSVGLGGKGANQSIAAAASGARVVHIGAVGDGGDWLITQMAERGVDTQGIATLSEPATGHAAIAVDGAGENQIIVFPGTNRAIGAEGLSKLSDLGQPGDLLLLQNETNLQREAMQRGRDLGLRIVYSAAPFDAAQVAEVLPLVDLLVLNAVELSQLTQSMGVAEDDLPVPELLVTLGSDGAYWRDMGSGTRHEVSAHRVDVVDTTGAGDTFLGYFSGACDQGAAIPDALKLASAAAALQVGRKGAADAIPLRQEVDQFLS